MKNLEQYRKKKKQIHIWLDDSLHKLLKIRVAEEGTNMQDWVYSLIEREFKQKKQGKKS